MLRVSTGQEAAGDTAFALDAVHADEVPRLRAILLAESLARAGRYAASAAHGAGAGPLAAVVAALQPAELHRAADDRRRGRRGLPDGCRCGASRIRGSPVRARLPPQRLRRASRASPSSSLVVLLASVVLSVLQSLLTYGNLVLRRDADVLHLQHGLLRVREHTFDMRRLRGGTLREPLLVRLFGGARLDAVMTGVAGAGEASLLLPPCPRATAEAVLTDLIARPDAVDRRADAARAGGDAAALDPGAGAARASSPSRWSCWPSSRRCPVWVWPGWRC